MQKVIRDANYADLGKAREVKNAIIENLRKHIEMNYPEIASQERKNPEKLDQIIREYCESTLKKFD